MRPRTRLLARFAKLHREIWGLRQDCIERGVVPEPAPVRVRRTSPGGRR